MNDVFKDMLDMCVVVYLDDILMYSENPDEHAEHMHEVLQQLHANSLFAKIEKCKFNVNTTNFLGFVITPDGIKMDESKVQVIQDWPMLRKVKDVQSFLSFTNFYHRFITNYSDMSVLLAIKS